MDDPLKIMMMRQSRKKRNNILEQIYRSSPPPSPSPPSPSPPSHLQTVKKGDPPEIKYENEIPSKQPSSKNAVVPSRDRDRVTDVYTDGACQGNGKKNSIGGIGVFFGDGDVRNVSRRIRRQKITNQTMELLASCVAIETFFDGADTGRKTEERLRVCTDSEYVVKSMNAWAKGWERSGWKTRFGKPVSNVDLMQRLYALKQRFGVTFVHVPAHRSRPDPDDPSSSSPSSYAHWYGNNRADAFATASIAGTRTQNR